MKTYATYGLVWALAGTLFTFALFFLGFHSDAEKLQSAQWIGMAGGLVIAVVCIVLGTQARRSELPVTEAFGYGSALGAGVMITLFATIFGMVANYVYMHFVNPGMMDLMVQAQIAKWEDLGMSNSQIEASESVMRKMMHPGIQAVFYFFIGLFFGTLISLITSIFLRRPAVVEEPPAIAG